MVEPTPFPNEKITKLPKPEGDLRAQIGLLSWAEVDSMIVDNRGNYVGPDGTKISPATVRWWERLSDAERKLALKEGPWLDDNNRPYSMVGRTFTVVGGGVPQPEDPAVERARTLKHWFGPYAPGEQIPFVADKIAALIGAAAELGMLPRDIADQRANYSPLTGEVDPALVYYDQNPTALKQLAIDLGKEDILSDLTSSDLPSVTALKEALKYGWVTETPEGNLVYEGVSLGKNAREYFFNSGLTILRARLTREVARIRKEIVAAKINQYMFDNALASGAVEKVEDGYFVTGVNIGGTYLDALRFLQNGTINGKPAEETISDAMDQMRE